MTALRFRLPALGAIAVAVTLISPAWADNGAFLTKSGADAMSQPYGRSPGQENAPAVGSTRDANGNRVIVNGMYVDNSYSSSSQGSGALTYGVGGSMTGASTNVSAIGNSLNVVVAGSYNTVIVNSTQNNSGSQTATVNGGGQ